jgi:hypothetical protein
MIRDRGRIKWNSLMLPEHVKMLRDWAREDSYEQPKQLDEQQLEWMNEIAAEAMEGNKEVVITHYNGLQHELVIGTIHYFDPYKQELRMTDKFDEVHYILLGKIADIRLANGS